MSTTWDWPGSRWWRVDLHAHSPASHDFRPDADREAADWSRWLGAARDAGIQAVAVTDHNTASGVEALQRAAAAMPGAPVIFPGVELTACDGTHLLLVLDPTCTQAHVDDFLSKAQIQVDQRGQREARSPLSVEQILEVGGARDIVLGAHVNGPAGLLGHDGQQRINELRHLGLAGVEVDPERALDSTWLDGSRAEIARAIPLLWCSDSHAFDEAGRRFTWVKMTLPSAEGLRLALLDGSASLRPARTQAPGDPNEHAAQVIESIRVCQAQYIGRWREPSPATPFGLSFNPWLNAVIGGRGTGKSTLVDLCRVALRRESELGPGGETSLRAAFDQRMRVPPRRDEEGLLTLDTRVEVTYRKDGERFVLSWDQQGRTAPIERIDGDRRAPEEGDIRERFPVRIYSQKQLFELAKNPSALLTIIDDTPDVRGAELERWRREAETKYLSLCAEARSLRAQAADLPTRRAALQDVRRKIELLEQGGHARTLNEYRVRRRQDGTWVAIQRSATDAMAALSSAAADLVIADLDEGGEAAVDPALASLRRAHEQTKNIVEELRRAVSDALDQAHLQLGAVSGGLDATAWRDAVGASEEQYKSVIDQLAQAGIANPDQYRDLLQRAATLEQEIQSLDQRRLAAEEHERGAARELASYRELRGELTNRRQAFTRAASNDLIRVEVLPYTDRGDVEGFLRDTLAIARFDDDYAAMVDGIHSPGTAPDAWAFEKLDATVAQLRGILADPDRQWPAQDRRFESKLRGLQPERIDRLALYLPEDAAEVSFCDPRGGGWKPLSHGSPGQQTAALLAFVLGYGSEPIILDQPEDDLDNTLIYELLVRRLRESKQKRQIIVVTHNPNIVVHGDADFVVSLESRQGQTRVAFAGGLQEWGARDEICRVMEGGREAFETRYRRIMRSGEARHG
ncbi:MAG: AAA family ATPase [Candidatus Eisenbacteria bacterium]|nr:AAA family ATPase [Candidatus Eisenbacteria bacterium]